MTFRLENDSKSMRDQFGEGILALAKSDPRVYVLDGDLANSTKISMVAESQPEKFLQMGIAEQNMIGVAAGMAATGLQPWTVTFAAFLSKRSLDQIQVVVAQPKLNVKMIGAYAGLLNGRAGKTHQAVEDIAIFRSLANMVVLSPADSVELQEMISFANEYDGPVYIRTARDPGKKIDRLGNRFELGKAVELKEGTDVTIISTGTQTARSLEAAHQLEEEGVSVAVLHIPSIKPIDQEEIVNAARKTKAIVTAEEHSIIGGLGGAVAEILGENAPVPIQRVGLKDVNIQSGSDGDLVERYGLSSKHIIESVKHVLSKKEGSFDLDRNTKATSNR